MRICSRLKPTLCFRTLNFISKFLSVSIVLKTADKSRENMYSLGLGGRPTRREGLICLLYQFVELHELVQLCISSKKMSNPFELNVRTHNASSFQREMAKSGHVSIKITVDWQAKRSSKSHFTQSVLQKSLSPVNFVIVRTRQFALWASCACLPIIYRVRGRSTTFRGNVFGMEGVGIGRE